MSHTRFASIVLLAVTVVLPAVADAQQKAEHFEQTVTVTHALDYLLYVPESHDPAGKPVPLLLFLHGAGERGNDIEKVKVHGPPKMIAVGHKFPAVVVSPQCPEGSWWTDQTDALIALLDDIESRYNIDPTRIYVTGLSMGGYGSWRLAAAQPQRFAAVIPICGGGERWAARALGDSGTPVWAFHGDKDELVPLSDAYHMIDMVNTRDNGNAQLTVYPNTGHDSWTITYANDRVWEWLFRQKRKPADDQAESE